MYLQAAEEEVPEVEPTVPGQGPGVYGCDYKGLARIAVLHAGARLDLVRGDSAVMQPYFHDPHVPPMSHVHSILTSEGRALQWARPLPPRCAGPTNVGWSPELTGVA